MIISLVYSDQRLKKMVELFYSSSLLFVLIYMSKFNHICFSRPVIVEIPHFGSMRGQERELILLRSENGETWKEHLYDSKTEDLNQLLNGMDEGEAT